MAGAGRRSPASVIERLRAAPQQFGFFQTVRLLERYALFRARDGRERTPAHVGLDHDPRQESVFLRSAMEMTFPPAEVLALRDGDKRPELDVTVMGLNGPSGVLPGHYSQRVMEELRQKNSALRDFLDIFNHRAMSLFLRSHEKYRLPLAFERAGHKDQDSITTALYALIGWLDPALRRRQPVADATLLFYAGHLSQWPRTAGALSVILSDYFEQPVTVLQFQGRWVELPEPEQTTIGRGNGGHSSYAQLGVNTVIGSHIWDIQGAFRIRLGPLDYSEFCAFMPLGPRMAELAALTRSHAGPALSFDVQLILKAQQVPALQLTSDEAGPRLGWNTWLPTDFRRDTTDAVFRVEKI
jgi:type VI secretion system protein ImpH